MPKAVSSNSIQSVERFLQILFSFTEEHPQWRVSDLSQILQLHPSTVSRLLSTGKRAGVVTQNGPSGDYQLGLRILTLSEAIIAHLKPVQLAYPFVSSLAAESQENAFLSVLDGLESVTVAQVAGPQLLVVRPTVGMRLQPNWGAAGRLLLAYEPETQVEALIRKGLAKRTEKTIVDPDQFRAELRRIRQQDYAISDGELEDGLVAVAAPVRDSSGRVIAAVSASGSSTRMQRERLEQITRLVRRTGDQISEALASFPVELLTGLASLSSDYRPRATLGGG